MNLSRLLQKRASAGKFGSMFMTQVRTTTGMHLVGVADLAPERARQRLAVCGWEAARSAARSIDDRRCGDITGSPICSSVPILESRCGKAPSRSRLSLML